MFYPNRCTDILATCDGGIIKQLQDDFHKKVGVELEEHYERMTATDTISRKVQPDFIMRTYNKSIKRITTEQIQNVAVRCGAIFELDDSLEKQFSKVKLRGYTEEGVKERVVGGTAEYKNVFDGYDGTKSVQVRKEWRAKEEKRKNPKDEGKIVKKNERKRSR